MQKTLKPRTIFCHDNLPILRGINTDSIDLIYLDPPFNKGRQFHAPIGTTAEGADFSDIWSPDDVKDEWHNEINDRHPSLYKYLDAVGTIGSRSAKYYIIYMAVRIIEMHRILKDSGTIYLHCDPTASHYLKLLMDTLFGVNQFRNELIWHYPSMSRTEQDFPRKHDIIFRYTKGTDFTFNADDILVPYKEATVSRAKHGGAGFTRKAGQANYLRKDGKIPDTVLEISHVKSKKEHTGYPTQKPLKLLELLIKASSNEGDLVLDPFCGCATTCIAAEKLSRNWVGIDVSKKAYELVQMRLKNEVPEDLVRKKPIFRQDIPQRTDKDFDRLFTIEDKQLMYGQQNGKCKGCGTKFEIQHLTKDHIVPTTHGGGEELENLQLLCSNCNSIKGDRPMEYLLARLKELYGQEFRDKE